MACCMFTSCNDDDDDDSSSNVIIPIVIETVDGYMDYYDEDGDDTYVEKAVTIQLTTLSYGAGLPMTAAPRLLCKDAASSAFLHYTAD